MLHHYLFVNLSELLTLSITLAKGNSDTSQTVSRTADYFRQRTSPNLTSINIYHHPPQTPYNVYSLYKNAVITCSGDNQPGSVMFLKKVIPCLLVALASTAMSGCVMADGGHHRGPSSDWHRQHDSSQNRHNAASWSQHAGPAAPANSASQHMGPPPAPDSAAQHMGPPADSGIHRWQP